MTAAISACEKVCSDIGWIAPLASVLGDLGAFVVGLGIFFGFRQLSVWRTEARNRSTAETAQACLIASAKVVDAIKFIRHPLDRIPMEDVGKAEIYYSRRMRRITERSELFDELRTAQIHQDAVIGDEDVSKAIDELFRIRNEIALAIEFMADSAKDADDETRKLRIGWRRTINGIGGPEDVIEKRQEEAFGTIKRVMVPFARYEKDKRGKK